MSKVIYHDIRKLCNDVFQLQESNVAFRVSPLLLQRNQFLSFSARGTATVNRYTRFFFIRTSTFWQFFFRFLHNLSLSSSYIVLVSTMSIITANTSIGLLYTLMHFNTVINFHVLHSFDFLLSSLSVSNCRKTCNETPHLIT